MDQLDDFINKVKHLPPAPTVLPQLLVLLGNADSDVGKVIELIHYDPSLTANVLQACNSVYFSGSTRIDNVEVAVSRLGFEEVYRMVAAVTIGGAFAPTKKSYGIEAGELWEHSVITAGAAQLMARDKGDDENVVFTAALLHDIGKIILAQGLQDDYAKLIEETATEQYSLVEAEKRLLHVNHAEIGGRLLARWKFPANLIAPVWFHHQPLAAGPHDRLAAYVYLGNVIAHFLGRGCGRQPLGLCCLADALKLLKISHSDLPEYAAQTQDSFEKLTNLFGVQKRRDAPTQTAVSK